MSYSNYSTYLKYKNCCRPIGDTGPPGPAGPTGPSGFLDISGNKGEIIYFKENNILGNTNNIFINNSNITIDNNLLVTGDLSMNGQFINDVSGIYFTQGNLLFSDFSSVNQSVQLPSSQGQPISLERKSLFYQPSYSAFIPSGSNTIIDFTDTSIFNQLKLNVSGNLIQPSLDISGQYVEIYANFDVSSNTGSTKTFSLDISSVSGAPFFETIDVRSITKQGSFYLTFGPHIFIPAQWENTTGFNFIINNETLSPFYINKYKLMFKSYFM
jgi:hypothetical protein